MDIHNLIMDIHNSIMDIHNYRVYAFLAFHMLTNPNAAATEKPPTRRPLRFRVCRSRISIFIDNKMIIDIHD